MRKIDDISELFDTLEPEDADALLEGIDSPGLDKKVQRRMLRRVLRRVPSPARTGRRRRYIAAAAACLAAVCLGAGGRAYALELEYNEAVDFFQENGLDTGGLTKAEIRKVYRDITSNSFTCTATAQVLDRSAAQNRVPGFDIPGSEPTPGQLREYWESLQNGLDSWRPVTHGVTYRVDETDRDEDGFPVFESCRLEKYMDGELVWKSSPITAFLINGCQEVSDGVIVYGQDYDRRSFRQVEAWVAKLDNDGRCLWTAPLLNDFTDEDVREVLELEDGTLSVLSAGWEHAEGSYKPYLCLTRLTPGGEITYTGSIAPEGGALTAAARLGEGYLALLDYRTLLRLDGDGNALSYLSVDVEGGETVICDLLEYGGQIYLSTYQARTEEPGRDEISGVLQYIYDNGFFDITSEELTPRVRDIYTAMLLILDPGTGAVRSFYSCEGCLGGQLGYGEKGELLWDVDSISGVFYSPATNSFTLGGTCDILRCAFSPEGALLSQEATGETEIYRR